MQHAHRVDQGDPADQLVGEDPVVLRTQVALLAVQTQHAVQVRVHLLEHQVHPVEPVTVRGKQQAPERHDVLRILGAHQTGQHHLPEDTLGVAQVVEHPVHALDGNPAPVRSVHGGDHRPIRPLPQDPLHRVPLPVRRHAPVQELLEVQAATHG